MKWIKSYNLFESKDDSYLQDKIKKDKAEVKKKIINGSKIINLINTYFLKEDFQNFCTKYKINNIGLNKSHVYPVKINYDHNGINNGAKAESNVYYNELSGSYANNIAGVARLLTYLSTNSSSKELPEETIGVKPEENTLKMDSSLLMTIGIWQNMVRCEFTFDFNYYGYKNIKIDIIEKNISKDITKKQVTETIIKCLQRSYQDLLDKTTDFNFDELLDRMKNDMVRGLKQTIGKNNYKLVGVLKHYPIVMNLLELGNVDIDSSNKMGEMGF